MENSNDLIRRQDALEALRMCYETERIDYTNGNEYINYEQAVHEVEQLPAAQPEQKTGRWINAYPDIEPNPMFMYGICSVCGYEQAISNKLNFCPNCGAKMEGEQNG